MTIYTDAAFGEKRRALGKPGDAVVHWTWGYNEYNTQYSREVT